MARKSRGNRCNCKPIIRCSLRRALIGRSNTKVSDCKCYKHYFKRNFSCLWCLHHIAMYVYSLLPRLNRFPSLAFYPEDGRNSSSDTSVTICSTARCHNPEVNIQNVRRCANFSSHTTFSKFLITVSSICCFSRTHSISRHI